MQKLFLVFFLILLNFIVMYGQARIDIPFTLTDGITTFNLLRVGLDTTATDSLDPQLGEFVRPPCPPGLFEAVFNLSPYIGSFILTYQDYRNAPSFPFTGTREHTLRWQLSSGAPSFTIFYNFPFGVFANLKDPYGGTLFNQNLTDSGSFTVPYATQIMQAILTMYYNSVIPVELTFFTASILHNEKEIELNWTTATETNNAGFEIERLDDYKITKLQDWEMIGFIKGHGTTSEPTSYSFLDEDITKGKYKYRLKQIDFDGTFNYSNEIEVEVDFTPKEFVLYQNYPNPFNPTTKISWQSPATSWQTLKIFDLLGNEVAVLVNEERPAGHYEVEFSPSGILASGIYFYKLVLGDFSATKKLVLMK